MLTVVLAFCLLFLVITGMAIGVLVQGKPIKGSCGGISALGMGTACDICGGDPADCEKSDGKLPEAPGETSLYHELKN